MQENIETRTEGRRIALIGFMGAGKTTVGGMLARRLGLPFLDLDDAIVAEAGKSVASIFAEEGEAGFRARERRALRAAACREGGAVLACGGGAALDPSNREMLSVRFLTVWLKVGAGEALRRTKDQAVVRPLLDTGDRVAAAEALLRAREGLYATCAAFAVDTGLLAGPEEVADAVMRRLGSV